MRRRTNRQRRQRARRLLGPGRNNPGGPEAASVSAEFAVVLPLVAISLLLVAQVSLLVWDQLRITHAAREGARELAVSNDDERARDAALRAGALDAERTSVETEPAERPAGTPARVTVRYRPAVVVPLVARFVPAVELHAAVSMRVERDP